MKNGLDKRATDTPKNIKATSVWFNQHEVIIDSRGYLRVMIRSDLNYKVASFKDCGHLCTYYDPKEKCCRCRSTNKSCDLCGQK